MSATTSHSESSVGFGLTCISPKESIRGARPIFSPRPQYSGPSHRRTTDPVRQFYEHYPCPLIHLSNDDSGYASDSSSDSGSISDLKVDIRDEEIYAAPRIVIARDIYSNASTASSSQSSPLSDVFTQLNLSNDTVSDFGGIPDPHPPHEMEKSERGRTAKAEVALVRFETKVPGTDVHPPRATRDIPTLAKVQAGGYRAIPLTPANLEWYMGSYQAQPKSSRSKSLPESSRSKSSSTSEHKSGWARMQESTRRMERAATSGKGAKMPWM